MIELALLVSLNFDVVKDFLDFQSVLLEKNSPEKLGLQLQEELSPEIGVGEQLREVLLAEPEGGLPLFPLSQGTDDGRAFKVDFGEELRNHWIFASDADVVEQPFASGIKTFRILGKQRLN